MGLVVGVPYSAAVIKLGKDSAGVNPVPKVVWGISKINSGGLCLAAVWWPLRWCLCAVTRTSWKSG